MTRIAIKVAAANLTDRTKGDEVGNRLLQFFAEAEVYHLEPPKGREVVAAFDWIVISRIADTLGIASALWLIYDKIIRPLKHGAKDDQGLYVMIDAEHGLQWFLGKDIKDREVFVKDFVAKVSQYQRTDEAGRVFTQTVREIQVSEMWVKRK